MFKILGVMCDNTSNNDKMFDQLLMLIDDFPGVANQTRCFNHILNLIAKSILHQFNAPKKKTTVSEDLEDATDILAGLELELKESAEPVDNNFESDNKNEEDITDGKKLSRNPCFPVATQGSQNACIETPISHCTWSSEYLRSAFCRSKACKIFELDTSSVFARAND